MPPGYIGRLASSLLRLLMFACLPWMGTSKVLCIRTTLGLHSSALPLFLLPVPPAAVRLRRLRTLHCICPLLVRLQRRICAAINLIV
jgi:hypothetical protein